MHTKNRSTGFSAAMVVLLSLFVLAVVSTAGAETPLPRFADHPVKERFTGKPALPDFANNKDARRYKSRIREGAKQGPNFAGKYTIIEWGCGSQCQSFAIVDAKTGAIYSPPFTSSWGLLYRLDSNLLIADPVSSEALANGNVPAWLVTGFYTWDGKQLNKIAESSSRVTEP